MTFIRYGGSGVPDDRELAKLGIGLSSEEVVAGAKGKKKVMGLLQRKTKMKAKTKTKK